jgi:hypothetical protein
VGDTLPNDAFTDELGLPTIWIPHSYPACAQHAPDEHLLAPLARQALQMMAALFWDLGEHPPLPGPARLSGGIAGRRRGRAAPLVPRFPG